MEEIKVDKDYIEAFNQGYEVAKELGLKSSDLSGIKAGMNRMQAMKEGMLQYEKEIEEDLNKQKEIIPPLDIDSIGSDYLDITPEQKDKDLDLEI
jgi:flagellar biosynthesis/type III secretory pathway protein FliH